IAKDASDDPRFKVFHNLPEDRYHAFLSVPVISKNEVIGVINVQHKRPHHHSAGELALLTTIGHQVGGAIENARLYEEMRKKAMQIETLSLVSKTIASNRYLKEILQLIVAMTAEMMNSTICSIMLLDEDKQELEIVATQSLSEEYRKKPNLKVGQSISGRAVKEKRPIAVLDVTREPGYMYADLARKEGLCSLLSVPMMIRDRAVGVTNSYTSHEHTFYDEEIKILQAVANQAAVAIENTKLIRRSNEMQEALENRKIVERAKGVLMREKKIAEEEAFRILQRQSMNTRKSMKEIAEAVILASEIK
ncbi:MAG TPA: GAF and ANTAR domain-containing protein, partial [Nitrospiria bacterium]